MHFLPSVKLFAPHTGTPALAGWFGELAGSISMGAKLSI